MDLFHFTMQQLAPSPLRFEEGDAHTVRAYLTHWLHRYHYPHAPRQLLTGTLPSPQQKLDALGWSELLADTAEFYGLPFPPQGLEAPTTVADLEAYVQQYLLRSAA